MPVIKGSGELAIKQESQPSSSLGRNSADLRLLEIRFMSLGKETTLPGSAQL
jgi:hypothetical protein